MHKQIVTASIIASFCFVGALHGQTTNGVWSNPSPQGGTPRGSWINVANWGGGLIPGGVDATVDFSQVDIKDLVSCSVDAPFTVGHVIFGDTAPFGVASYEGWTLTPGAGPGPLTLATSTGAPTISTLTAEKVGIQVPLAGASGFVKDGDGRLFLNTPQAPNPPHSISGPIVINGGTLSLNCPLPNPVSLVVNSGATLEGYYYYGDGLQNDTIIVNTGGTLLISTINTLCKTNENCALDLEGGVVKGSQSTRIGDVTIGLAAPTNCIQTPLYWNSAGHTFLVKASASGTVVGTPPQPSAGATFNIEDGSADDDLTISTSLAFQSNCTVTKTGAGRLTLTGTAGIGTVAISAGSVAVGNGGSVGTLGGLSLNNNAWLLFNRNTAFSCGNSISGSGSVVQLGSGVTTLTGAATYSGATAVSNGTLLINTTLSASSNVTVAAPATLGGSGTIVGPVTVNGTLTPGAGVGTLTLSSSLTLSPGSACTMEINRGSLAADKVQGLSSVNFGGVLTVTNLGGTFQLNDTFALFAASTYHGNFAATNLPPLDPSLRWQWNSSNGTLAVVSANITLPPTNISFAVVNGGTQLQLSWPAAYTGWKLWTQTNTLATGLGASWYLVPGSVTTNQMILPIVRANPAVFYRLSSQ